VSLMTSLQPLPPLPPIQIEVFEPVPYWEEPEEVFPSEIDAPLWLEVGYLLVEWVIENAVVPLVEEIVDLVTWMEAEVAVIKHEVYLFLAEVYKTDLGFLLITIGTMLLSIYLPQWIEAFKESTIGQILKRIQDWMGEGLGRILELMAFVDLVAISEIMEVVWPLWRDLMGQLSAAISGLAGELAEGTGYIHAWVSVVYGLVLTSNSLLGIDSKVSAVEALEKSEEFTRNVSENFRRYAHDPGLIVSDIIENYYVPYANRIKDGQLSLIESITTNRDTAVDLMADFTYLNDSLEHFIRIQPAETAAIVAEKLGPISDSLNNFVDGFNQIVLPGVNGLLAALETRADRIEAANASAAEKIDDPLYSLAMYDLMTPAEQKLFNRGTMLIAAAGENDEIEALAPALDMLSDAVTVATQRYYFESVPVVQPPRAALTFEMPGIPAVGAIPGWYQGED